MSERRPAVVIGVPVAQERFWYVQQSEESGGLYLLIYADHMDIAEDATMTFFNADGTPFQTFLPGTWTHMEHGEYP
jgi:hypothetical protein